MENIFYRVVKNWFKLSSWEQNVIEIFKKERNHSTNKIRARQVMKHPISDARGRFALQISPCSFHRPLYSGSNSPPSDYGAIDPANYLLPLLWSQH